MRTSQNPGFAHTQRLWLNITAYEDDDRITHLITDKKSNKFLATVERTDNGWQPVLAAEIYGVRHLPVEKTPDKALKAAAQFIQNWNA